MPDESDIRYMTPTVKVEDGHGSHIIINAADYNPDEHTLCEGERDPLEPTATKRKANPKDTKAKKPAPAERVKVKDEDEDDDD